MIAITAGTASFCTAAYAQPPSLVAPADAFQTASRDVMERHYRVYELIGSQVLNLDGERIGEVENFALSESGDVGEILLQLNDSLDTDGGPIAVPPHRFEIVSVDGPRVMVLRTDLTREEIVFAQLVLLKSDARAPAERDAGPSDVHREPWSYY